ncbi:MAG: hypothetical protein ACRC7N_16565 [Clostridium sp.]
MIYRINQKRITTLLLGAVLNIIIFLLIFKIYGNSLVSIENINTYIFAYFDINNIQMLIAIVITSINTIMILIAVGDDTATDLKVMGAYLFTRGRKRSSLLINSMISIIIFILTYLIFQIFIVTFISMCFKFKIQDYSIYVKLISSIIVVNLIKIIIIALLSNVMSLVIDFKYTILIILGYQITIFSLCKYTNAISHSITKFLPTINSILGWYEIDSISNSFREIFYVKNNFGGPIYLFLYNIIILSIILYVGIKILNKKNIV